MADEKGDSVAQRRRGVTVAPSPLNGVKLELAIILFLGIVVWVVHYRLPVLWAQFALLGGYGFAAMMWLLWRTRRVIKAAADR